MRGPQKIIVRVDPQSSLKALKDDRILNEENINLEIGSSKNKQKNSVAEKAIRELREEIIKVSSKGGKISETQLCKATMNLNFKIRHTGHSAKELWVKRDQNFGQNLEFEDKDLSDIQYKMRVQSHDSSARYESRNAKKVVLPQVKIGDKIFIKSDGSKSKARDPYLVLAFVPNKNEIEVQKFLDKNRKNFIRVHLQNVFKANPVDEKEQDDEDPLDDDEYDVHENTVVHETHSNQLKDRRQVKGETCFYCINMKKRNIHHSSKSCLALMKVRPRQKQAPAILIDSSESSEDDYEGEEHLMLFSDDEHEEFELEESVNNELSINDGEENLLDMAIDHMESNFRNNRKNGEDNDSEERQEVDKNEENEDSSISGKENEDEDDVVLQDSVIQHLETGKCCTDTSAPRARLGARSLPGRSIVNRNLAGDAQGRLGARRRVLPGRVVNEGDVIRYLSGYDGENQEWLRATVIPMTLKLQRKYPTYYNILNETGDEMSVELIEGARSWQVLHEDSWKFVGDDELRPA